MTKIELIKLIAKQTNQTQRSIEKTITNDHSEV